MNFAKRARLLDNECVLRRKLNNCPGHSVGFLNEGENKIKFFLLRHLFGIKREILNRLSCFRKTQGKGAGLCTTLTHIREILISFSFCQGYLITYCLNIFRGLVHSPSFVNCGEIRCQLKFVFFVVALFKRTVAGPTLTFDCAPPLPPPQHN